MGSVFLSYRRSDSREVVGRMYDRLVAHFPASAVFRDLDSIPLGRPFPTVLKEALTNTTVALVVIGPAWVSVTDEQGRRRLDDSADFVRQEVEALLSMTIPVIPCLVSNATMPAEEELPSALRPIVSRQAVSVRPDPDFHRDMDRLITHLGTAVTPAVSNRASYESSIAVLIDHYLDNLPELLLISESHSTHPSEPTEFRPLREHGPPEPWSSFVG